MNITSDINKNIDLSSVAQNEEQGPSILSPLFSINFESDVSSELNTEKEFFFKGDEVEIISYLSNFMPNFIDLMQIKNKIEIDPNIDPKLKENMLSFLSQGKISFGDFNINTLKINKTKNKDFINQINNRKPSINQKNLTTKSIEIENKSIDINVNNSINKDNLNISKTFENMSAENQNIKKKYNGKNENTHFVRKIKKNNHPNKIYQLSQSNALKYKQLNDVKLQLDQKLTSDSNFHLINTQTSENSKKNNLNEIKIKNNQILNSQNSLQFNNGSKFSQQNASTFTSTSYNSVFENFVDNLDLTQKGWTSKLVSRIDNALINGGEEIEFNLKPKNLGTLKVSVKLKNGIGNVKIIAENSFVTGALNQNENYLQKLFNEQGINLDFSAQNEGQNFGSKNKFNQNSKDGDQKKSLKSDSDFKKTSEEKIDNTTLNNSSRHMVNVIA